MKLEIKQDATKEVLRGKFTAMNAHTKTQEEILRQWKESECKLATYTRYSLLAIYH